MPRAGLTSERVVREAADLADEVGLTNVTLAAMATRLGVRVPSLYKHIDGLDAVHREVAVQAKLELAAVVSRACVGRSGPDALRVLCRAYRGWAREHPGRYAATQVAPDPTDDSDEQASATAVGVVYDVLSGFGLRGAVMIDATRSLRSALHGFVVLEELGGFGMPRSVDRSFEKLVDGLLVMLNSWGSGTMRA